MLAEPFLTVKNHGWIRRIGKLGINVNFKKPLWGFIRGPLVAANTEWNPVGVRGI
jgi:hypothetical protein